MYRSQFARHRVCHHYRKQVENLPSVSTPRHVPGRNGLRPQADISVPTLTELPLSSPPLWNRHMSGVEAEGERGREGEREGGREGGKGGV